MTEAKKAPAKRAPRRPAAKTAAAQPDIDAQGVDMSEQAAAALVPEIELPVGEPGPAAPTNMFWAPLTDLSMYSVDELWSRVMESVRSIGKGDYNHDQGFKFRGVDATVDAVGPALRAHAVKVIPKRVLEHHAEYYESHRGRRMVNRTVRVEWEVRGPQGDWFTGESMGEAADAGDKSMAKAQSVAYRVFLLQALCVPTGEPDPDSETHERAGDAPQQQGTPNVAQRGAQAQRDPQAQAGEENQAAQPDNEEARKEMWRVAKALGWQWANLAARFKCDYNMETAAADPAMLEGFTAILVAEAEEEEDRAKAAAAQVLGAKEVAPDEAQSEEKFPESRPGSERLL